MLSTENTVQLLTYSYGFFENLSLFVSLAFDVDAVIVFVVVGVGVIKYTRVVETQYRRSYRRLNIATRNNKTSACYNYGTQL